MGSFITRDFAAAYGDELNGIILYGSSGTWPGGEEAEKAIQKICDEGGAKRSDPEVAGQLMGWMFARCSEGVKLGHEWICSDPYVQKDHAADPFDAFSKPIQMLLDITGPAWAVSTTSQATRTLWASTEGASMRWLIDSGHEVTTKLYSGYRHEIHNDKDIKGEVADGMIAFLDDQLPKKA